MATTQTALITGASTGIGAVYADRLALRGHNLVLVARSGEKLAVLAAELHSKYGVQVETMSADLANAAQLARVARRLADDEKITMLPARCAVMIRPAACRTLKLPFKLTATTRSNSSSAY